MLSLGVVQVVMLPLFWVSLGVPLSVLMLPQWVGEGSSDKSGGQQEDGDQHDTGHPQRMVSLERYPCCQ